MDTESGANVAEEEGLKEAHLNYIYADEHFSGGPNGAAAYYVVELLSELERLAKKSDLGMTDYFIRLASEEARQFVSPGTDHDSAGY